MCQIVRVVSNLGGVYKIEYEPTLHLILKTFGLYEISQQESIEICHTMDGALQLHQLPNCRSKILDKRAIDLCLGRPLCSRMDNLLGFSCQSQNFCFIFKSLIGKDSKDAYNNLKDFF